MQNKVILVWNDISVNKWWHNFCWEIFLLPFDTTHLVQQHHKPAFFNPFFNQQMLLDPHIMLSDKLPYFMWNGDVLVLKYLDWCTAGTLVLILTCSHKSCSVLSTLENSGVSLAELGCVSIQVFVPEQWAYTNISIQQTEQKEAGLLSIITRLWFAFQMEFAVQEKEEECRASKSQSKNTDKRLCSKTCGFVVAATDL